MATILSNTGKAICSGLVTKVTTLDPKFIGIGSAAGTAAITDTTLFTEFTTGTWTGYARTSTAGTQVTTTTTNDAAQWVGTFTAPAAETVTNAGNFDATTVGNLFVKGDFAGVVLANGDSIQVTIKLTFV
jgi:hypothetical protein